jgi:CRP-like cAMP-binding protein
MVLHLPGVDAGASSAVCALTVAKFLAEADKSACPSTPSPLDRGELRCPRAERPVLFDVETVPETHQPTPIDAVATGDLPAAVAHLRSVPVFRALPASFLGLVASRLQIERYAPGSIILEKGQPGRAFFVIAEGEVEVVGYAEEEVAGVIHTLKERDCFGEMSLLTGAPTIARVVARTEVVVQTLDADFFDRMLRDHPFMAARFARILASRLIASNYLLVREGSQAFRGKLSVMGVSTVLQVVSEARRSGRLHLRAPGGREASIAFRDGRVVDAELDELQGAEAVYAALTWEAGDFWLEPSDVPEDDDGGMGVMGLLLEGMRRIDEGKVQ